MTCRTVLCLLVTVGLSGCTASRNGGGQRADLGRAVQQYKQVRATILGLPANQTDTLVIQLGDIPGFVGPDGRTQPVSGMTLPFRIEASTSSPFNVGDAVEIDLEVDWDAVVPGRILSIRLRKPPL